MSFLDWLVRNIERGTEKLFANGDFDIFFQKKIREGNISFGIFLLSWRTTTKNHHLFGELQDQIFLSLVIFAKSPVLVEDRLSFIICERLALIFAVSTMHVIFQWLHFLAIPLLTFPVYEWQPS